MKKSLIAAAMLMISASADAATYRVDGVTIHVPTHCASTVVRVGRCAGLRLLPCRTTREAAQGAQRD